jgi:sterol desaturase/sphingolipid hydroxylase (fatty acid hydroxylase superfamily)
VLTASAAPRYAPLATAAVVACMFGAMLVWELARPLRRSVERKTVRIARNLTNGGLSLLVAVILQTLVVVPVAQWTFQHRVGLLNTIDVPGALNVAIALLLLDYTLWIWHWASHRVPFLWRFHLVHHIDRDLDASTALRFHFGEHGLSTFYRAAQIAVIGASPLAVWIWQLVLFASIFFHHANVALPVRVERVLVRLLVTPRMHGIHHSTALNETNSNWSSILAVWDYLHGTILLSVPQRDVVIGVPAYQQPRDVTIGRTLALPFVKQRGDFLREDGTIALRDVPPHTRQLAE